MRRSPAQAPPWLGGHGGGECLARDVAQLEVGAGDKDTNVLHKHQLPGGGIFLREEAQPLCTASLC